MYEYKATVMGVHDGDTVTLNLDLGFRVHWEGMNVRLLGINAPELSNKPAGPDARDYLRDLLPVGLVILLQSNKDLPDKYGGRWDGTIWTGTWEGDNLRLPVNVNQMMITSGHAVRYP